MGGGKCKQKGRWGKAVDCRLKARRVAGWLTHRCRGSGPHGSNVIAARLLRLHLGADTYPAPSAQDLHTDHSDALPCGRKPDPRHVCPFWFVKLQVVGLANGPN